ncbi:MAG: secondary thiamine-phosphate synthase enzyme YjbQ [Mariprofundaceae bacterium]
MKIKHRSIEVETDTEINIHDITPLICKHVEESGIRNGFVTVTSRHSTTALCVNEHEILLLEDIRTFFEQLVPKDAKYRHNDLHLRENVPPGEPQNAHSHIAAILFGSSEIVHIAEGKLQLGTFQAVMMIELDGPKKRTVNLQIIGT